MKYHTLVLYLCLNYINVFSQSKPLIITSDIDHFWVAYDKIIATTDSITQYYNLQSYYLDKATPGLTALREARNYTPQSYINAIQSYPKFWNSVRKNTFRYKKLTGRIEKEIAAFKKLYPDATPAEIYFCIGALRTGGTALGNKVLIGNELAFADNSTVVTDFPAELANNFRKYFDTYSDKGLITTTVHEYVHTQQKEMVHNLLSQSIYEGVAEFVSTLSTGAKPSGTIRFGKANEARVKYRFEQEMFNNNTRGKWLWSIQANEFGERDLGYYIGYELCERHYNNTKDKKKAIKEMIELDYTDTALIEKFVDDTHFFSIPVNELRTKYEASRPTVTAISGVVNGATDVAPKPTLITITFSEPMDKRYTNFESGPSGEDNQLTVKRVKGFSEDGRSVTIETDLLPGKHYQLNVYNGFRTKEDNPLIPYLIDFKTADK